PNTPPVPSTMGRQERCQYAKCRATTAKTGRATAREATVSGHKRRNVLISSSNGRGSGLIMTSIGGSAPADRTVNVTRTTANRIAVLSDASPQAISLALGHSTTSDRLGSVGRVITLPSWGPWSTLCRLGTDTGLPSG